MSYKLAVASSDGKVINQHFGRATQFLVFEVEKEDYRFLELREANPFCQSGEHDDGHLLGAAQALKDCRAVLVSQIGRGAASILRSQGTDAFDIKDLIETAIHKLIKYYSKIDGGKVNG